MTNMSLIGNFGELRLMLFHQLESFEWYYGYDLSSIGELQLILFHLLKRFGWYYSFIISCKALIDISASVVEFYWFYFITSRVFDVFSWIFLISMMSPVREFWLVWCHELKSFDWFEVISWRGLIDLMTSVGEFWLIEWIQIQSVSKKLALA